MQKQCKTPVEAAVWLRGFFDGEGCVSFNTSHRKLDIGNTDRALIEYALRCLDLLGIAYKTYEEHPGPTKKSNRRQTFWRIVIRGRLDIIRFIRAVGCIAPHKRSKMARLIWYFRHNNTYHRTAWNGPLIRPTRDELLPFQGRPAEEIAAHFGLPLTAAKNFLSRHGLGQRYRQAPQPDPQEVRRAYWDEGLTLKELDLRFGYSGQGSILAFMNKHGIPRRSRVLFSKGGEVRGQASSP